MDKQKQDKRIKHGKMKDKIIEEMAREIAKRDCHLYEKCLKEHKHNCVSQNPEIMLESSKNYITIATWLVNAGYRKIPENAVVLTGIEKEERFIDLLIEFDEMGFEPTTLPPQDMGDEEYTAFWKNRLLHTFSTAIKNARKETAEKFAERLKAECFDGGIDDKRVIVSFSRLDEICKEITEGVK